MGKGEGEITRTTAVIIYERRVGVGCLATLALCLNRLSSYLQYSTYWRHGAVVKTFMFAVNETCLFTNSFSKQFTIGYIHRYL